MMKPVESKSATVYRLLVWSAILLNVIAQARTDSDTDNDQDLLWPNKQLNVLIDIRSLNSSEQEIIESSLEQIEHKTCVRINRLQAAKVNPFDTSGQQLDEKEKNFVYLFKSHVGLYNRPPTIGLSTLGCAHRGRQSVVLTDSVLRWPEVVLSYHLLRSLGVQNLKKPSESELAKLQSQQLPLSQKISQNGTADQETTTRSSASPSGGVELDDGSLPALYAFATGPIEQLPARRYLSDDQLMAIKQLYDCPDYQNRLSVKPPAGDQPITGNKSSTNNQSSNSTISTIATEIEDGADDSLTAKKLRDAQDSLKQIISSVASERGAKIDDSSIEKAAKSIVHYLLAELEGEPSNLTISPIRRQDGKQLENLLDSPSGDKNCRSRGSCSDENPPMSHQERSTRSGGDINQANDSSITNLNSDQERSMLLKLDPFHASDPQLRQANQMKLSRMDVGSFDDGPDLEVPQTYRLLNQTPGQSAGFGLSNPNEYQSKPKFGGKSEMMISFEQSPESKNPIDALAGSQVLKLCSCTCQAMTPLSPTPPPAQSSVHPSTEWPDSPTYPTGYPTTIPPRPQTTGLPTTAQPQTNTMTNDNGPKTPSKPAIPSTIPMTNLPPWTVTDYPSIPSGTPTWPPITNPPPFTDDDQDPEATEPWLTPWPTSSQRPTVPVKPPTKQPTRQPTTSGQDTNTYSGTFTYAPTIGPSTKTPTLPPTTTTTSTTTPTAATTTTTMTTSDISNSDDDNNNGQTIIPSNDTTSTIDSTSDLSAACDQVQWVKPNKTIYSSAKIVWDVDRANQNYFLCQAQLDGELIPGKTHGLSCKVSSEGKAYEMHQFQVLIKPESVNLAWVQKDSKSFGTKNLPVIGGYSMSSGQGGRGGDPYVVSRCLVKDENNDVITLIGYINRQNVGWFPFDDIQIECSQYDVLACVN